MRGRAGAHRVPSGLCWNARSLPGVHGPTGAHRTPLAPPKPLGKFAVPPVSRGAPLSRSIPGSGHPSRAGADSRRSRTPTRRGPRRGGGCGLFTSGSALEDLPNSWNSFPRGGRREGGVAPCLQSEISHPRSPPAVFSIKVTPSCCRVREVCTVVKLGLFWFFFYYYFKVRPFFLGPGPVPGLNALDLLLCKRRLLVAVHLYIGKCMQIHFVIFKNTTIAISSVCTYVKKIKMTVT